MDKATTNDGGIMDAIKDIFDGIDDPNFYSALRRFENGGPDTQDRIKPYLVEKIRQTEADNRTLRSAVGDMMRSIWGAVVRGGKILSDDNIDEMIAKYIKSKEGRRRR